MNIYIYIYIYIYEYYIHTCSICIHVIIYASWSADNIVHCYMLYYVLVSCSVVLSLVIFGLATYIYVISGAQTRLLRVVRCEPLCCTA